MAIDVGASEKKPTLGRHLSRRQREIVELIASGLSNKQIGLQLKISSHTVDTYLARVYQKYDVHSRTAIVAAWLGGKLD